MDAMSINEIRIRPTLLVGLGGTGGDVLLRVRRRFYEKFGNLQEFPIVGYLWVDTDRSEKHILAEEIKRFARFSDSERALVTLEDTAAITQHLDAPENRGIKEWWYPGLSALGTVTEGAGQIRAYSRLAFFKHYADIRQKLEHAHGRVRDIHNQERMQNSAVLNGLGILADVDFGAPTNVILVSSVAGGTGSGMLLDMGFLIKDVLGEQANVLAHLVFPGHFGNITNDRMRANGYAFFKELNHYQYGTHRFEANWDPTDPRQVEIPPFACTYVYDHVNSESLTVGTNPRSQEMIFETLAESIFKDFTHGSFADEKRSARVNFAQFLTDCWRRKYQDGFTQSFPQRYLSLGFSSISVPHHRIMTACAYRLAAEVVDLWGGFGAEAPNQASMPEFLRAKALPELELVEDEDARRHDLLFALQDPDGTGDSAKGNERGLMRAMDAFRDQVRRDVERGAPRRAGRLLRSFLEERIESERMRLKAEEVHSEPEHWGHHPRMIRGNSESWLKARREALRRWSFRLVDVEGYSLAHVQSGLKELGNALEGLAARLETRASEQQEVTASRQRDLDGWLKEASRWERRGGFDGRTGTIHQYLTMRVMQAAVGDLRQPGVLRSELRRRLFLEGARTARALALEITGQPRPDGTIGGGLVEQFTRLKKNLTTLATALRERSSYFASPEDSPHSDVLYRADEFLPTYYQAYVKGPEDLRKASQDALETLQRQISGLTQDHAQGLSSRWEEALVSAARRRFSRVPSDFHVLKVLRRYHPGEAWKARLKDLYRRSGFWVTGSQVPGAFKLPPTQVVRKIGLPGPAPDMDPADIQALKDFAEEIRRYIVHDVAPHATFTEVAETGEILFYQEAGGFPVNFSARLSEMRVSYLRMYAQEELHIDRRDENFADLAILTEQEQEAVLAGRRAFLLGSAFDILKHTGHEYVFERREGAMSVPTPLGSRAKAVVLLTSDAALRQGVLDQVETRLRELQGAPDLEVMARWYAVLTLMLSAAYGSKITRVKPEEELEFESMLAVKVLKSELARTEQVARAAALDWGLLSARAEAIVKAPNGILPWRQGDERWLMPRPEPSRS